MDLGLTVAEGSVHRRPAPFLGPEGRLNIMEEECGAGKQLPWGPGGRETPLPDAHVSPEPGPSATPSPHHLPPGAPSGSPREPGTDRVEALMKRSRPL